MLFDVLMAIRETLTSLISVTFPVYVAVAALNLFSVAWLLYKRDLFSK
jgi:hypothetical protein